MNRSLVWAVALAVLWPHALHAATLTAGYAEAEPGATGIALPVSLAVSAGEQVSGIQFDLVFDPDVLVFDRLEPGPVATDAGKSVAYNEHEGEGRVTVLIVSMDQNTIASGDVAISYFGVSASAPPGEQTVALADVVLARPTGEPAISRSVPGAILVLGGAEGEGEGVGEGEGEGETNGCGSGAVTAFPGGPFASGGDCARSCSGTRRGFAKMASPVRGTPR